MLQCLTNIRPATLDEEVEEEDVNTNKNGSNKSNGNSSKLKSRPKRVEGRKSGGGVDGTRTRDRERGRREDSGESGSSRRRRAREEGRDGKLNDLNRCSLSFSGFFFLMLCSLCCAAFHPSTQTHVFKGL